MKPIAENLSKVLLYSEPEQFITDLEKCTPEEIIYNFLIKCNFYSFNYDSDLGLEVLGAMVICDKILKRDFRDVVMNKKDDFLALSEYVQTKIEDLCEGDQLVAEKSDPIWFKQYGEQEMQYYQFLDGLRNLIHIAKKELKEELCLR